MVWPAAEEEVVEVEVEILRQIWLSESGQPEPAQIALESPLSGNGTTFQVKPLQKIDVVVLVVDDDDDDDDFKAVIRELTLDFSLQTIDTFRDIFFVEVSNSQYSREMLDKYKYLNGRLIS